MGALASAVTAGSGLDRTDDRIRRLRANQRVRLPMNDHPLASFTPQDAGDPDGDFVSDLAACDASRETLDHRVKI